MSTKILIVDNHGMVREGLHLLFEQHNDLQIVGEASDGRQAIEMAYELKPDIIIMDISMPGLNGIDASQKILDENPNIKIVALSAHCNTDFIKNMLTIGASGYILKDCMADELINCVRIVMAGEQYLSAKVAKIVVNKYITNCQSSSEVPSATPLTSKERELIQLLTENKSNKEAAMVLNVSVKTVDARRRNIMSKIGITGIADLTKFAIREGLTTLDI
jgi:DNA-binding NarL/FixJ family response regulator